MIATRWRAAAFSYLELLVAMLILTLCIVPAARMLPGVLAGQRGLETRYQLSLVAQDKLETAVLELDDSFVERDESGDLTAQGHPDWRYRLVVTIPAAGSGRYATVRSEAWVDETANTALDADEPQVVFETLHANCLWEP